jgi:hypothetical protein
MCKTLKLQEIKFLNTCPFTQKVKTCGLYYKNIFTFVSIVSEGCTINVQVALAVALASVITYNHK